MFAHLSVLASKACLFGNDTAHSTILATDDPCEEKRLGHQFHYYDHGIWKIECKHTGLRGNLAKFSQIKDKRLVLDHTGGHRLTNVSPDDGVWGIGLRASDRHAPIPDTWCGHNLLG